MSQTLTKSEKTKLRAIKNSLPYFARNFLKIKTKAAKIVPLEFNQAQSYFHQRCERMLRRTGKVRIIAVKGRQTGLSTYVAARFYHKTTMHRAMSTFILSHEAGTTDKLFKMVKLYQERNVLSPAVRRSNSKELDFEAINSNYYVGTAGSADVGRGGTVQLFHGSEVAMWKNTDDIQTGLMESIPDLPDTEIILESTAKGMGNFFHKLTMAALAGKNEYEVVFIPWFWMDEYEADPSRYELEEDDLEYTELYLQDYDEKKRLRKLAWRRNKINGFGSAWKFKQEYPATVQEAFQTSGDSLIKNKSIIKARQLKIVGDNPAPLILGIDPARTGDRIAIAFRRGRILERIIKIPHTGDDMILVGKIAKFIDDYGPVAANIDCTDSYAIYDRLKELGYGGIVHAIHFGSRAIEDRLYLNKRVEMWCNLRDWIHGEDVSIPDDDEIHIDFSCVPDYKETSDQKIRLISKQKIKELFGLSPDLGDAAALTFAVRVHKLMAKPKKAPGGGLKTTKRMKR